MRFSLNPTTSRIAALTGLFALGFGTIAPAEEAPKKKAAKSAKAKASDAWGGIVQIENSAIVPDYRTPWNGGRPSGGSGTGFLIGENLFMTNAHVVSNSSRLLIRKVGNPEPLPAELLHIAHDCDLAILKLVDPSPFEDIEPLEIGGIPKLDTEVIVVGYPIGGERMSVTRGVVSRVDFNSYSHSGVDQHLTIQIDAAINPGNSGGPVLQDGKVVGVAFQGYSGSVAQNVGYMIPTPVVNRLITDIKDGKYDHYVDLAVSDFPIQNPAQVKALGLPDGGQGVQVSWVDSSGSGAGIIEEGDVLLEIDGSPIASNGLIEIDGELVNLNEIVERKFAGDEIKVKLWRDSEELARTVTLKRFLPYLIQANAYDVRPTFAVQAGLVFQPLDKNMMAGHGIDDQVVSYWFNYFTSEELYKERPEPVVLTSVLPDEINSHFRSYIHSVVDTIDGVKVTDLRQAHKLLNGKPPEDADPDFLVIRLIENGRPLAIERSRIEEANARILSIYNINEDHYLGEAPKNVAHSE